MGVEENRMVIERFRAENGVLSGDWAGTPLLLLHTVGARSGTPYVNPVMFLERDGRIYVFASAGGRPRNPGWLYNLRAHPAVTVELGPDTFTAVAKEVTGAEREAVYSEQEQQFPAYREFREHAGRTIPVIALDRA